MAAGHGHVHYIESGGQYHTDNDASLAGVVHIAGVRASLQLDMRHSNTWGTIYAVVFGRDVIGFEWSSANSNIWCDTGSRA
jgi:hypothetical protein